MALPDVSRMGEIEGLKDFLFFALSRRDGIRIIKDNMLPDRVIIDKMVELTRDLPYKQRDEVHKIFHDLMSSNSRLLSEAELGNRILIDILLYFPTFSKNLKG
jgi:hypothetical protein